MTIEKLDQVSMLEKLRISKSSKLKVTPVDGKWQIQLEHESSHKNYVLTDPNYNIKLWIDPARALNYVDQKLRIPIENLHIERGKIK